MNQFFRTASLSLIVAFSAGSAIAAGKTPAAADATQTQSQKERAKCMDGTSNQDRATCLKEAGAAQAEAKRGALATDNERLRRNARERCESLPDTERTACRARMRGEGTTSGSAQSGGMSRELVTKDPAPAAPATPVTPVPPKQ